MATQADKITHLENEVAALKQVVNDRTEALNQANITGASRQEALANSEKALKAEREAHELTKQLLEDAQGEAAGAADIIAELNQELSSAQEAGENKGARTVKHDGITYEVVIPKFRGFDGKSYTAADVVEGSALLADLVARRSGVIVAID